jgi:hypothetical protein
MKMKTDFSDRLSKLIDNSAVDTTDLSLMEGKKLQIRFDTKFLISADKLIKCIEASLDSYKVLDVKGVRLQEYDSCYYDSPDMRSYNEHLRSKSSRYKIRKRSYVDSNLHFLEIKQKENTGRTLKHRIPIEHFDFELDEKQHAFLQKFGHKSQTLAFQIRVRFHRITLISKIQNERVTMDFGLSYERNGNSFSVPYLGLVEVKQDLKNRNSIIFQQLKLNHIRSESFSKYCLGMTLLEPEMKSNMYKEKILKINKMKTEYGILSNTILR